MMRVLQTLLSQKSFPTGDPNFAVMQAFPGAFSSEAVTDPFLMCDVFGPTKSKGIISDPDKFIVGWHPHRGMDICTYMIEGIGRHADSLGNRETFASPGLQWISVGSGIEHAEAGGTPAGQNEAGFQIWINVPRDRKMLDPQYGTRGPSTLPILSSPGQYSGRLLAGKVGDQVGPFKTATSVEMIDMTVERGQKWRHAIDTVYDNVILVVYKGGGIANETPVNQHTVLHMDAADPAARQLSVTAGADGLSCMLFSGKRINEPIAWRGPFVMNTQAELQQVMNEMRSGTFPPVRVKWDYKRLSTFPADHQCKSVE